MQYPDARGQLFNQILPGLHDEQRLARLLNLSLPPVGGRNGRDQIGACGKAFFNEGATYARRLVCARCSDEDDDCG